MDNGDDVLTRTVRGKAVLASFVRAHLLPHDRVDGTEESHGRAFDRIAGCASDRSTDHALWGSGNPSKLQARIPQVVAARQRRPEFRTLEPGELSAQNARTCRQPSQREFSVLVRYRRTDLLT